MADRLIVLLPAVTGVLYALTAVAFLTKRKPSWAIVYFAYAMANVGLIWSSIMEK